MVFAALLLVVWVCAPPEAWQCHCAARGAMGQSTRPSDDGCFPHCIPATHGKRAGEPTFEVFLY